MLSCVGVVRWGKREVYSVMAARYCRDERRRLALERMVLTMDLRVEGLRGVLRFHADVIGWYRRK